MTASKSGIGYSLAGSQDTTCGLHRLVCQAFLFVVSYFLQDSCRVGQAKMEFVGFLFNGSPFGS